MAAPFMTLIFLLVMAMVGFLFDLYLFSHGAFGGKYVKNRKFKRTVPTATVGYDSDRCELFACSDTFYENERAHSARTMLIVLSAAVLIVGMVLFMLINSIA